MLGPRLGQAMETGYIEDLDDRGFKKPHILPAW